MISYFTVMVLDFFWGGTPFENLINANDSLCTRMHIDIPTLPTVRGFRGFML